MAICDLSYKIQSVQFFCILVAFFYNLTLSSATVEVIILHLIAGRGGTAPRQTPRPVTSSTELRTPCVSERPPMRIMASGRTHSSRRFHMPLIQRASRASKETKLKKGGIYRYSSQEEHCDETNPVGGCRNFCEKKNYSKLVRFGCLLLSITMNLQGTTHTKKALGQRSRLNMEKYNWQS